MVKVSHPAERATPPEGRGPLWRWFYEETIDHLFPWNGTFLRQGLPVKAAGIGLAVVVTASWILALTGQVSSAVVIGWWIGWSVYEVIVRKDCKPWVKEGPWWGSKRRPASTVDLIAYVATKNLLIGAGLFLLLSMLGLLRPIG